MSFSEFYPATDTQYLERALELAALGVGWTAPNPAVGCVIVRDGETIGEGYHEKAGEPHAERNAIADARARGASLPGATLYVTLEPCSSFGRTPPCVNGIVENEIQRVVVGCVDPDPRHRGAGLSALQRAGIQVTIAPQEFAARCVALNPEFHQRWEGFLE